MANNQPDILALFTACLNCESDDERARYLEGACQCNARVRARVEELLRAHRDAGSFLDSDSLTVATPPAELPGNIEQPGTTIGRYELIHEIGQGGMGVVYMAAQSGPVKRNVALKIIKPGMDTREVVSRFEAERQTLALMDNPNIAHVLDGGSTDSGLPYFVMELVEGSPVTAYCDDCRYTTRQRLQLFTQVCQAVQHAHQKGIIHRDLKPSNILVTTTDDVAVPKVIDFGIAKAVHQTLTEQSVHTQATQIIGTPLYMSPEQAQLGGQDVDTRTDVYSLGVVLYQLLTGTTPFDKDRLDRSGLDEARRIIREEEPPRPSIRLSTIDKALETIAEKHNSDPQTLARELGGELDWIVMKCLEKDRTRRYESASELAKDVQRYLDGDAVLACPPSTLYVLNKFVSRHRGWITAAAAFGVLILVAVGLLLAERGRTLTALANETNQRQIAQRQHKIADEQRNVALINQYHAEMVSGQTDWERGNLGRLSRKLVRHLPLVGHQDHRGWEWYYLMALSHSEKRTLFFPGRSPFAAWSPDGDYIAAAGSIWRADSGENIRRMKPSRIVRMRGGWSADGKRFAWGTAADDSCIYVWDRTTDQISELRGHESSVWSVCWSPDGKQIASGGMDTAVRIWDVASRSTVRMLDVGGFVTDVAWSPNGQLVAAGVKWNDVKIWEAVTGKLIADRASSGARGQVQLSWHPDSQQLAVSTPQAWFLIRGPEWTIARQQDLELAQGWDIAWCPRGEKLAVADGVVVSIWRPADDEPERTLHAHLRGVYAVGWSPSGEQLVTSDLYEEIKVWDLNSLFQPLPIKIGRSVQSLTWMPDNATLVVADQNGSASFWNAEDGQQIKVEQGATERSSLRSPDQRLVAELIESEQPPKIQVVEAATGAIHSVWEASPDDQIRTFAWSFDSSKLAIRKNLGEKMSVEFWDVDREQRISQWRHSKGIGSRSQNEIAWSLDGTRLAVAALGETTDNGTPRHRGHVYVVDVARGETILKHNLGGGFITSIAWKPDGRSFVAGNRDGLVEAVDADTGHVHFSTSLHNTRVTTLAWSPSGRRLVTSAKDGLVKILSTTAGEDLLSFALSQPVTSVAWSPNGHRLAAGTEDGEIQIWDASRGYEFSQQGGRPGELAWAYYRAASSEMQTSDRARLREVLRLAPDKLDFWEVRGHVNARLGNSTAAEQEFAKLIKPGLRRSFDASIWYGYSLLGAGKREAYRRHCAALMNEFADTPTPSNGHFVACLCAVTDNGDLDWKAVLKLVEIPYQGTSRSGDSVLAATLYRDGQYEQAARILGELIKTLHSSSDPSKRHDLACSLYVLAMARYQLGHDFQARRLLDDAAEIDETIIPSTRWWEAIERKTLESEARNLIDR